jgi:hypothetical protein
MEPIKLSEIIEKFNEIDDDCFCYFNTDSGELLMVRDEYMAIAAASKDGEKFDEYKNWEREFIAAAMKVLKNWNKYEKLPDNSVVDEYHIMDEFSCSYANETISQKLSSAIHGRGAFRRFKELCIELDIEDEWYKYKENTLFNVAREWCELKKIQYII